MNAAELEAIGICIAVEAINDIVNHALLEIRDVKDHPGQATAYFPTRAHQQLFLIRLLDFAKENGDVGLTGVKGSCLDLICTACEAPSFDIAGSVASLRDSAGRLRAWLQAPTKFDLWLPTIEVEVTLNVPRTELLFISGNQAKHNVSRLTGLSRKVREMLKDHGHDVPLAQIPLALGDFTEHLSEHFFVYYGTWLAQLVNDVRWGIQEYLLPTYRAAYRCTPEVDEGAYRFKFPELIKDGVARSWFWRLMNYVRSEPYIKKFSASEYMKMEDLR